MTVSYDNSCAVVLLPEAAAYQIADPALRRWLTRATFTEFESPVERLQSVLRVLNRDYVEDGLAALRMWGQTGDRPTVWIAAADPVSFITEIAWAPDGARICLWEGDAAYGVGDPMVQGPRRRLVMDEHAGWRYLNTG